MLTSFIDRARAAVADLAGVARCPWCERPSIGPCPACRSGLPWNRRACSRCASPLAEGFTAGDCCARCLGDPPPQDSTWTAFRYEEPIRRQIRALKFHADFAAADVLAEAMADGLRGRPAPDLLLPVPLHRRRLRRRGYNQAVELGRALAARLGLALAPRLAERRRATEEQTHLGAIERRRNLHGAFTVSRSVTGRRIALLDDVITTGATVAELARATREAGAARVEVWAVARTP